MLDLPGPRLPPPLPRHIYEPLFRAGVGILQLRMKGKSAAAMLAVLDELHVRRPPGALIFGNDRLDVALAGRADGVHLGQDDLPLAAARRVADALRPPTPERPRRFLIGISTHNEAQAEQAIAGGADYIAFGPIFATATKKNPDPVVGLTRLRELCRRSPVPVVAIGGITLDKAPAVVEAGAHAAAIIAAVNQAPDIEAAARRVQTLF